MKKYKVWLHVEEIDEETDYYQDLDEHTCSIGPEFDTEENALALRESLLNIFTDLKSIILTEILGHGKVKKHPKGKDGIPLES